MGPARRQTKQSAGARLNSALAGPPYPTAVRIARNLGSNLGAQIWSGLVALGTLPVVIRGLGAEG
jgi:hypothetical protein